MYDISSLSFNTISSHSVEEFLKDGFYQKAEKFLFSTYNIKILLFMIFMEIIYNRGKQFPYIPN